MRYNNKYFWIKLTVTGLTALTITTMAYFYLDPRFSQVPKYTETAKEIITKTGNVCWNYEISQHQPNYINFQNDQDYILIN